jgi:ABC-type nickel/cobalt efflux system permease component RcnA
MTMLDVHSLAVIGAGLLVALAAWLVWVVIDRRRRQQVAG